MSNPVKPTSRAGLGIVNRHGDFWSERIFETAIGAESYFRRFWENSAGAPQLVRLPPVPARVTIEEISDA